MNSNWVKDTGILLGFVALLLGFYQEQFFYISGALLLITILAPALLTPVAWAWFKVSEVLSAVIPPVIFGAVFYIIVFPIGFLRKMFGGDPLKMSHKSTKGLSAFIKREHKYSGKDLMAPF